MCIENRDYQWTRQLRFHRGTLLIAGKLLDQSRRANKRSLGEYGGNISGRGAGDRHRFDFHRQRVIGGEYASAVSHSTWSAENSSGTSVFAGYGDTRNGGSKVSVGCFHLQRDCERRTDHSGLIVACGNDKTRQQSKDV